MNKRVEHALLSAALTTPDEGLEKPGRAQPTSAITQITALAVGDCWSRVEPVRGDMTMEQFARDSAILREALRNTVQASVRHAKGKTGGTYSVETGDFIASNRSIYLVCVVTRCG